MKVVGIDNNIAKFSSESDEASTARMKEILNLHGRTLDFFDGNYLNFLIDQEVSDINQNYLESVQIVKKINLLKRDLRIAFKMCNVVAVAYGKDIEILKHLRMYQTRLYNWNCMYDKFQRKHSLLKLKKANQLFYLNELRANV